MFQHARIQIELAYEEKEQAKNQGKEPPSTPSKQSSSGSKQPPSSPAKKARRRSNSRRLGRGITPGLKALLLQADFKDGLHEAILGPTEGDSNAKLHIVRKFYENLHENYYRTVKPLLHDISARLELGLLADYTIDSADLFIWATISGHFESTCYRFDPIPLLLPRVCMPRRNAVAKLFWQKTKHPLAMAMLGSFVCKYVGQRVRLLRLLHLRLLHLLRTSSAFSTATASSTSSISKAFSAPSTPAPQVYIGHSDFEAQAEVMESWVVKSLNCIPEQLIAHELLGRTLTDNVNDSGYTLLDLAMFLGMKKVMAQHYCETLMEKLWRGGSADSKQVLELPKDFRWMLLVLHVLTFGFLNPTIYAAMSAPSAHLNC